MKSQSMDEAYRPLLHELHRFGIYETNVRTGVDIRMLYGGHSFKLDLADGRLPVAGNRRYWPKIAAAETAWQFMGTQSPDWILENAPKMWQDFVEDGKLKTAYGYRWREHFGRDQLSLALEELENNPSNRQIYISSWDPATDGLGGPQPKNIPCPVGFSLTRTGDALHCSVFIRSSDVFIGLPYDIMCYSLTLDAIAASIRCFPATMHVTLAHPHYYMPHASMINECLLGEQADWTVDVQPLMPGWTVTMILQDPKGYLDQVLGLAGLVDHSDYSPVPELVI